MSDDFCVVTGLPLIRLPAKLVSGPCSRLTGVLYYSVVRKSVQKWSFWHDRVVMVTHNKFIVTDEDGTIKRFHNLDHITKITVDKKHNGKLLILVGVQVTNGNDVLLSFNSVDNGHRFISVLETVLNTSSSGSWMIAEGNVEVRSADRATLPKIGSSCSMTEQEIYEEIERDGNQLAIMMTRQMCPITGLPYVEPPTGLTAPNFKMLYCGNILKLTAKGKEHDRVLFVTLQRIIVADMAGNVKRFQSTHDIVALKHTIDNEILLEMTASKDLLLHTCPEDAAVLMNVIGTVRKAQSKGLAVPTWKGVSEVQASLEIRKGDSYVPPQVTLFTLRGAQHRRRSTFVLGSFCSHDAAQLLDKVAKTRSLDVQGIVERAEKVERTRLWQRDLPEDAEQMDEQAEKVSNSFNSVQSVDSVPCVINAFNITIPCDLQKCVTCFALNRQIRENSPPVKSPGTLSVGTPSRPPPAPLLGDPYDPLRVQLSAARIKIHSLEQSRKSNTKNIDALLTKLRSATKRNK
eukprot:TRINITY_DN1117_c0_g1_i1.p1 TRINITY_DN1117_c0_g1~~TRINITY_DN1117_c0_g1_i1.p1  ORF type:complete len:517 (+),score=115.03 TRINITY_DN1117_c0_g1_i1:54-1604(+)